jgi:hypothetical protein
MTKEELEDLERAVVDLRRAVRRSNPFLKAVVQVRYFSVLAFLIGTLFLAFGLVSQFLDPLPPWWRSLSWIAFALFLVGGSIMKWIIIGRRAKAVEKGAKFSTVIKAFYGGNLINLTLSLTLCIAASAFFAVWIGHPWYIVPVTTILLGLACLSLASILETKEYAAAGWSALASGYATLFFVESAPFLCVAIVGAAIFLVFGTAGLMSRPESEEGRER